MIVHTHFLNIDGFCYAFDYYNFVLLKVDEPTQSLFMRIAQMPVSGTEYAGFLESLNEKEKVFIQSLLDKQLFISCEEINETIETPEKYGRAFFSFATTHSCNLMCDYCFASHGENAKVKNRKIHEQTIKEIFDFMCDGMFSNADSYRLDFVSGGEPLLNVEAVKTALSLRSEYFKDKPFQVFLCTNGTINDKNIWELLNNSNVALGVSIDGPKAYHDKVRSDANGDGSFDKLKSTLDGIIHNRDYDRYFRDVWALNVITPYTESLVKNLKTANWMGIKRMQMKIVRLPKDNPYAFTDSNKLKSLYEELLNFFMQESDTHNYEWLKMVLNDNDYWGKIFLRMLLLERALFRCNAGKNKLAFDSDGNIYPCDSFVGNDNFKLGNVKSGINEPLLDQFKSIGTYKSERCLSCWNRFICGGDCYHNSYICNNDMEIPDSVFCETSKYLTEKSIALMLRIKQNNDWNSLISYAKAKRALQQ